VIYDGYANAYSLKKNGKGLTFALLPLPKPHKAKPGKGSQKSPYRSETREACATRKSKPQIALLMVKPNIVEEVEPLSLIAHEELED